MAVLHKILLILSILDKDPYVQFEDALDLEKDEITRLLDLLTECELVDLSSGSKVLTDKGKNILDYFNSQLGLDSTPLIRVQ